MSESAQLITNTEALYCSYCKANGSMNSKIQVQWSYILQHRCRTIPIFFGAFVASPRPYCISHYRSRRYVRLLFEPNFGRVPGLIESPRSSISANTTNAYSHQQVATAAENSQFCAPSISIYKCATPWTIPWNPHLSQDDRAGLTYPWNHYRDSVFLGNKASNYPFSKHKFATYNLNHCNKYGVEKSKSVSVTLHGAVKFNVGSITSSRWCLARRLQAMTAISMTTLLAAQWTKRRLFGDKTWE